MPHRAIGGLRYSTTAAREFLVQLQHCAKAGRGLELRFEDAVRQAELSAIRNPNGFARVFDDADLRVIVVRGFPFRLLYAARGDFVLVVALAHTARPLEAFLKRRR